MSEGTVFVRADGRICAKYTDAKGKTRYLYGKTSREVRRKLRQALRDRDEGLIPPSKMTVGAMLDEWLEEIRGTVSHRTWVNQESIVRRHLKPNIGTAGLAGLDAKPVRSLYRDKLAEGLCGGTVKRIHTTLNQAMKEAIRLKYIRTNPLDDVEPPKQHKREMGILSRDDVRKLLDTVRGDRLECVYVLGAMCVLRIGEILPLRYEDLDLAVGTLTVRRTLWRGKVYPPKTNGSRRTIKLPSLALDALRRHAQRNGQDGWVFPTSGGRPVAAHNFHRCDWKPTLKKAGLPETTRFHDLRHGAASLLLNQNVPVPVVSSYLGHANSSITMRVYAHMLDGTGMAADGMDEALGESQTH